MSKRGRPMKPRTSIEPIAPAALRRLMDDAIREVKDPRLGTEVGRLWALGRMTATEAAAAFRVAEIYGRYERLHGVKRSSRSPSYEVGYGGGGETAEGENDQKTDHAWMELQGQIPSRPQFLLGALETLAVENRCILPNELEEVRELLRALAVFFGIVSAKNQSPKLRKKPKPTEAPPPPSAKMSRSRIDRDALRKVLTIANPNWQPNEIDTHIELFFTLKERELFRAQKERANS